MKLTTVFVPREMRLSLACSAGCPVVLMTKPWLISWLPRCQPCTSLALWVTHHFADPERRISTSYSWHEHSSAVRHGEDLKCWKDMCM